MDDPKGSMIVAVIVTGSVILATILGIVGYIIAII